MHRHCALVFGTVLSFSVYVSFQLSRLCASHGMLCCSHTHTFTSCRAFLCCGCVVVRACMRFRASPARADAERARNENPGLGTVILRAPFVSTSVIFPTLSCACRRAARRTTPKTYARVLASVPHTHTARTTRAAASRAPYSQNRACCYSRKSRGLYGIHGCVIGYRTWTIIFRNNWSASHHTVHKSVILTNSVRMVWCFICLQR